MGHDHVDASDRDRARSQPPPSGVIAPAPAPVPGRQTRVPQPQSQPQPQVVRPRGAGGSRLVEPPQPTVTVASPAAPDPMRRTEVLRRLGQMTTRILRTFDDFERLLHEADQPYTAAYEAHTGALQAHADAIRLRQQILLTILQVGIGGMAGGAVQQIIRGASQSVLRIAVATGGGDLVKYGGRLPDFTSVPDEAAAGPTPHVWFNAFKIWVHATRSALLRVIEDLYDDIDTEHAIDGPYGTLDGELRRIDQMHPTTDQQFYAGELWRRWMQQQLAQQTSREQLGGFLIRYQDVIAAIHAQCPAQAESIVRGLACEHATTGPGNRDALGRRIDQAPYGCR